MSIIHSSSSRILYALSPGKPDPSIECTKDNISSRPRILQSAQKGPTCWYYALNMIRVRIGKKPSEDLKDDREIESVLSKRRKLVTAVREQQSNDLDIVRHISENPSYTKLQLFTKDGALKWLPKFEDLSRSMKPEIKKEAMDIVRILKEFSQQDLISNLQDYIKFSHANKMNDINHIFLKKLGKDPETYFELDQSEDNATHSTFDERKWSDVMGQEKRALLENYIFRASYEGYHLKVSNWHPENGSSRLVEVLKENGPMYVKGQFGRTYYETLPQVVQKIATTSILGWQKGAIRKKLEVAHSVIVVGAQAEGRGFVYYVDPLDESEPEKERQVYVSSYENFINCLGDLRNRQFPNPDGTALFSHNCGYGLHSP